MHLGQISLCDSVGYNIKSDEDKKKILEELDKTYSVRVIKRHHENFVEGHHVEIINRNPYLMSVRTNGNPYYLYLTRCNFVNQCVLVDKKVQQGYFYPRMILVRLWFDDRLFDNTLFEGEMVRDKYGGWTFLINDMTVFRNIPQNDINLVRRLNCVYEILATWFKPDEMDVCTLRVKKYFFCSDMHHVVNEFVPKLPYTCRGLYFKPFFFKFRDILLNFDESLIKKIIRKTYKGAGNFLLMSNGRDGVVVEGKKEGTGMGRGGMQSGENVVAGSDGDIAAISREQNGDDDGKTRVVANGGDTSNTEDDTGTCRIDIADAAVAKAHCPQLSSSSNDQTYGNLQQEERVFWVRHTNMPDVYELYSCQGDVSRGATTVSNTMETPIACVPNLSVSRTLRAIFCDMGVTDAVPMVCVFNTKFQKWTPLRKAE